MATSLALDGLLKPLILRTYCNAAARTSSSFTSGSKLNRGLMFRHICSSSTSALHADQHRSRREHLRLVDQRAAADVGAGRSHGARPLRGHEGRHIAHILKRRRSPEHRLLLDPFDDPLAPRDALGYRLGHAACPQGHDPHAVPTELGGQLAPHGLEGLECNLGASNVVVAHLRTFPWASYRSHRSRSGLREGSTPWSDTNADANRTDIPRHSANF